jgi:hypothetical protein
VTGSNFPPALAVSIETHVTPPFLNSEVEYAKTPDTGASCTNVTSTSLPMAAEVDIRDNNASLFPEISNNFPITTA